MLLLEHSRIKIKSPSSDQVEVNKKRSIKSKMSQKKGAGILESAGKK